MAEDGHMRRFYSDRPWHGSMLISRIIIHRDLFLAYVELAQAAKVMTERMDEVLDHPKHIELINGGFRAGYKMPNVDMIQGRNWLIKFYLDGLDPLAGAERVGKDQVMIPAKTARALHLVAEYSASMIDGVVGNIHRSQYMPWIRTLREAGDPYSGPTSLQEVFNLWSSLATATVTHAHHAPDLRRRLPENWLKLVI